MNLDKDMIHLGTQQYKVYCRLLYCCI